MMVREKVGIVLLIYAIYSLCILLLSLLISSKLVEKLSISILMKKTSRLLLFKLEIISVIYKGLHQLQ